MILFSFALIINLTVNSCGGEKGVFFREIIADTLPTQKMIPYKEDSSIGDDEKQLYLRNISKNLNISLLDNGMKGLYIRIWLWGYHSPNYIITIRDDSSKMLCSTISWSGKTIDSTKFILVHNEWNNLIPKSGWTNFFAKVNEYKIKTMKSGLPSNQHRGHLTRMSSVQFEIVEDGKYRYYEYLEPSYYRYVEKGSNNIYQFLKFFNREMGIEVFNPPDKLFEQP